jgi:BirA family biotin operon repressor/biotin-[acetyl-CoA-carboxylase] ligase
MSVRQALLLIFEKNRDVCISGSELAAELSVSRAAVWKAVKSLCAEGYRIQAVPHKGYRLLSGTDILSEEGIRLRLLPEYKDIRIVPEKVTASTNTDAKALALAGAPHGTLVIAEEQSAGRGRMGRAFYSPKESGIYMSLVLRPELLLPDAVLLTTAAAVAVSRAIETVTGKTTGIKWVNDIFYRGRKAGGILTEVVSGVESGTVESAVVGIGVNFRQTSLPAELQEVAGSLFSGQTGVTRNVLAAEIVNRLLGITDALPDTAFLDEYRRRSIVLGKDIRYLEQGTWNPAKALAIDDRGGLIVERPDGSLKTLVSGEVSVRVHTGDSAQK